MVQYQPQEKVSIVHTYSEAKPWIHVHKRAQHISLGIAHKKLYWTFF
jgi:hypothetical protein